MNVTEKNLMEIEFDLDCMEEKDREKLEDALVKTLLRFGWFLHAQYEDTRPKPGLPVKHRNLGLQFCPNKHCEYWDDKCSIPTNRCLYK